MLPYVSCCGTRRQRRAEEGFELQAVEVRSLDPSMLHQDLKGSSHPVRLEEMDGRAKLRALLIKLADHVFHPKPHEKTHLIGKACHAQAGDCSDGRQTSEVHMGGHVLLTDTHIGRVAGQLLIVAKECSVLPIRSVQILRRMPIIDGHHKSAIDPLRHLVHPFQGLEIHLGSVPIRPGWIQPLEVLFECGSRQGLEAFLKAPVSIVHTEFFGSSSRNLIRCTGKASTSSLLKNRPVTL